METLARRKAPLALALALMSILLAGGPGEAGHGGGSCGRDGVTIKWVGAAECTFTVRGLPITIYGDARVASGEARVRVVVTDAAVGDPPVLLECSDRDPGFTDCDNSVGSNGGVLSCRDPDGICADIGVGARTLRCRVSGVGSGAFWCQSASGR